MNIFVSKITFVILIILMGILALWLSIRIFFILIPFLIAYALSKPLNRFTAWIHKRTRIPLGILTFIVVLFSVSLFVLSISFMVYKIAISLSGFSGYLNSGIHLIQNFTSDVNRFQIELPWLDAPFAISDLILQLYNFFLNELNQITTAIVDALLSILKTIPVIGLFFFFMFISLYFFIKDQVRVRQFLSTLSEKIKSPFLWSIKDKTVAIIKNYFKAQFILISITFFISLVALTILKIPFSPLVALGIAFIDLIPMVGPAFVYVPWIIFMTIISEYSTAIGLLITYLLTTLTRQTIEPKIVSTKIGAHPLITIISMYACYRIFGVGGFILGAVLVMLTLIALDVYREIGTKDEH